MIAWTGRIPFEASRFERIADDPMQILPLMVVAIGVMIFAALFIGYRMCAAVDKQQEPVEIETRNRALTRLDGAR